ncbi:uncharacterized protein AC631_02182 [Debaryomyces fabryi]|uniref:NDT80 domain-containing protein n=1 Tax=Debaryomyces fabryi TaxID=58627 RepID=A0A0V1Q0H2_9ASCO|nr:uncharacterized protein AC631_02182 [Debaryomyces fabryi]KSA02040.1 hypothetical protein AC631_02182 [Debaryomyces fabryi]CUM46050.1 unnamed protein product [Debaryomyces fabryi]
MEDRSTEKDQYDDLASLFLPDILHPIPTENVSVKQEELEHNTDIGNLLREQNESTKRNDNNENFSNFMSNNNFINGIGSLSQGENIASNAIMNQSGHINHYANFVPIEAAASIQQLHHQLHRMYAPINHQYQQLYPSSHTQPQNSGNAMRMGSPTADLNWFTNPPNGLETFPMDNKHMQIIDGNFRDFESFNSPNPYSNQSSLPSSFPTMDKTAVLSSNETNDESSTVRQKEVKDKTKKRAKKSKATSSPEVRIDYKAHKLTRLLDLKEQENASDNDFKIVDKDNNEIKVQFQSYLTGRFFTNDTDNNNYIISKLENAENGEKENSKISWDPNIKMDPKVISCYRRNYIQISMNLNLSGFSKDDQENNKVLKLQTNEYGYSITRVIKWFKVEILANTNVSEIRNIPIIIYDDNKERDKERPKDEVDSDETNDFVNPISIDKAQSTITLNESVIKNSEIDNYYTIKKLQFKSATPNNGNLTFQNYYHLKIKVSAIVADLYYDDYIDEDYSSNTFNERNEVNLFELVSEPIIVRGRNPSFYADRKDILIKGRSINSRESFINAGQETKTENEEAASTAANEDIADTEEGVEKFCEDEEDDEDEETENEASSSKRVKSNSPSKLQPYNNQQDQSVPPLLYSATSSSSINLKSMLENSTSKVNLIPLNKSSSRYKYFPISNVYYLPPINAVYFPHRAHQQMNKEYAAANSKSPSIENDDASNMVNSPQKRKNSNVYFR